MTGNGRGTSSAEELSRYYCAKFISDYVKKRYILGYKPLFVLGSGISSSQIPGLSLMAGWFLERIRAFSKHENPEELKPLEELAEALIGGWASRLTAAEFFHMWQETQEGRLWDEFCHELIEGITIGKAKYPRWFPVSERLSSFTTVTKTTQLPLESVLRHTQLSAHSEHPQYICPTKSHLAIARLLSQDGCYVATINFDPLVEFAMEHLQREKEQSKIKAESGNNDTLPLGLNPPDLLIVYSPEDLKRWCSANSSKPVLVKARGDVFRAHCREPACNGSRIPQPLDWYRMSRAQVPWDTCIICGSRKAIRLELLFPGFEIKEAEAAAVMTELRTLLAFRVSVIIVIGLSGQWDEYLLEILFGWANEECIPIVNITTSRRDRPSAFEEFRRLRCPMLKRADAKSLETLEFAKRYIEIDAKSDDIVPCFVNLVLGNAQ
jgi:hypothetical protein